MSLCIKYERDTLRDEVKRLKNDNAELRKCLKEALSGIDEFMTRTIYFEHGKDIDRWHSVLSKTNGDDAK